MAKDTTGEAANAVEDALARAACPALIPMTVCGSISSPVYDRAQPGHPVSVVAELVALE